MTVTQNLWLGNEPLGLGGIVQVKVTRPRTEELLDLFRGTVSSAFQPDVLVRALPPDEKQIVEILKAYNRKPRLLILDEATASLDNRQVTRLFELVREWKSQGMAVVFVSHRMYEIFNVADRATVLRSGRTVGTSDIRDVTERDLVELMIEGGVVAEVAGSRVNAPPGPVRLKVQDLETRSLHGVSLELGQGEILGMGGLRGQGQSDVLRAIFGAIPFKGKITLDGEQAHFSHPHEAMRKGIALVPGDRGTEGLLYIRSILENMQLPSWQRYGLPLQMRQAWADAANVGRQLNLVMASLREPVSSLSGGNAQKVVLGKWLMRNPQVLLLDDPTKGIDVGAKAEFYQLLNRLQEQGVSILFYSSDDDELLGLCNRVLVLHDGRIQADLVGTDLNRTELVAASLGTRQEEAR